MTWIHVSEDLPTYSQTEIQQCVGDTIEIAVTIANLNGIVDLNSLVWHQVQFTTLPKETPLTYDRNLKILKKADRGSSKVYCNTNRICEIEDAVVEWLEINKRQQPMKQIDIGRYEKYFQVLEVRFNDLDHHYSRIILKAKRAGHTPVGTFKDLDVTVRGPGHSINNEVKKRGFMFDKNRPLQLRIGDQLVVYVQKFIERPDDDFD